MTSRAHLLGLSCSLLDPLSGLLPVLVEREQPGLSTTLDELIGLSDELRREHPARDLGVGSDGVGRRVPCDLRDLGGGEDEFGLDLCRRVDRGRTLEPVGEDEFRVVFADGLYAGYSY